MLNALTTDRYAVQRDRQFARVLSAIRCGDASSAATWTVMLARTAAILAYQARHSGPGAIPGSAFNGNRKHR